MANKRGSRAKVRQLEGLVAVDPESVPKHIRIALATEPNIHQLVERGRSRNLSDYSWRGTDQLPLSELDPVGILEELLWAIVVANPIVDIGSRGKRNTTKTPEQYRVEQALRFLVGQKPRHEIGPPISKTDEAKLLIIAHEYLSSLVGLKRDRSLYEVVKDGLANDSEFVARGLNDNWSGGEPTESMRDMINAFMKKFRAHRPRLLAKISLQPLEGQAASEIAARDEMKARVVRLLSLLGYTGTVGTNLST